jgi:hypothetical protein
VAAVGVTGEAPTGSDLSAAQSTAGLARAAIAAAETDASSCDHRRRERPAARLPPAPISRLCMTDR